MEPAYLQKKGATIPLNNNFKRIFALTIQHWADFSVCNGKGVETGKGFTSGIDLRPDTACAKAWLEYRKTVLACQTLSGHGALAKQNLPRSPGTNVTHSTGESLLKFERPDFKTPSNDIANIIDRGACTSDGTSPLASIDWVAYDDGRYFLTTSNITLGHRNRTWSIHMPPAVVKVWSSYEFDVSQPRNSDGSSWSRYYSVGTDGPTISSEELLDKTLCQPTKVYQWGFSSLLLSLFGIATMVSSAILLALNAVIWQQTRTKTLSVDFSIYRDILDLAGEIKAELGEGAEDLSATVLNDRIKTDTGNVRITEDLSLPSITSEGGEYSLVSTEREALQKCTPAVSSRVSGEIGS